MGKAQLVSQDYIPEWTSDGLSFIDLSVWSQGVECYTEVFQSVHSWFFPSNLDSKMSLMGVTLSGSVKLL